MSIRTEKQNMVNIHNGIFFSHRKTMKYRPRLHMEDPQAHHAKSKSQPLKTTSCDSMDMSLCSVTQSCPTLCDPVDCSPPGLSHCEPSLYQLSHQGIPRILEWVAYPFSRGSPSQGSNPGLPHCRWIPYQLSHKGSTRILEYIAYSFSGGSF